MRTVIWRFATLDLHGSRILKWLAMYRRGIIVRRKSCLLGRSMMLQSTSGVQAVSSQKCSRENPYSLERTVSLTISPLWINIFSICQDVNQFSIITELLGSPPDDVIDTIASENVRFFFWSPDPLFNVIGLDATLCPEFTQTRTSTLQ